MRTLWVLTLGMVALAATQGCKRKEPEPIPGPKAGAAVMERFHTPGIAWFQGSFDEAFAKTNLPRTCATERGTLAPPLVPDPSRTRNRLNSPSPVACHAAPCPSVAYPRRPLV
jgi:hypothetical protein